MKKLEYYFLIISSFITISLNNIYGTTSLINSIYVLNLDDKILSIENERTNDFYLNTTYKLGYIGSKHILKLHKDGLL